MSPRWRVLILLGLMIAAGAYLLGKSGGNSGSPEPGAGATGARTGGTQSARACSRHAAIEAVLHSRAALGVRRINEPEKRRRDRFAGARFSLAKLICHDLDGDGAAEMLVQLACCTAATPTPWAIFRSEDGRWELSFHRVEVPAALTLDGDEVVEKTPAYKPDDKACCPSGFRFGRVAWNGKQFVYHSKEGDPDRTIAVGSDGVLRVGAFRPQTGSPRDARKVFGQPSFVSPRDELCIDEWRDLGLTINFASLGGRDPRGPNGKVGSIELAGLPAEQARWATDQGVRVGMTLDDARDLYPSARTVPGTRGAIALIESPSPTGDDGTTPVLTVRARRGEVTQLGLTVGAAGE